jgi:hypothetical protein
VEEVDSVAASAAKGAIVVVVVVNYITHRDEDGDKEGV